MYLAFNQILGHFPWLLPSFLTSPWKPLAFLHVQPPSLEWCSCWALGAIGEPERGFSTGLLSLSGIRVHSLHTSAPQVALHLYVCMFVLSVRNCVVSIRNLRCGSLIHKNPPCWIRGPSGHPSPLSWTLCFTASAGSLTVKGRAVPWSTRQNLELVQLQSPPQVSP